MLTNEVGILALNKEVTAHPRQSTKMVEASGGADINHTELVINASAANGLC
jgi:hypothetical protein